MASRRLCLALLAAGLVAAASGCATAPVGGSVQALPGSSGQPQAYAQPLPPPGPRAGWSAEEVVEGFIAANASFALDPDAARAYLAPGVSWTPPTTVQIVSNLTPHQSQGPLHDGNPQKEITVSGQRIATLSSSGQYQYSNQHRGTTLNFYVGQYGTKMLINVLPGSLPLLLTQQDFEQVFQPENLYFLSAAPTTQTALVPDPVYAPVQGAYSALSTNLATGLVDGLIDNRGSWLSRAATTAFPRGTTLIGGVTIVNQQAVVNLGGAAAAASRLVRSEMYTQLSQTLTSSEYGSPPVASSVDLEIKGKAPTSLPDSGASVPSVGGGLSSGQKLFYASEGLVAQVTSGSSGKFGSGPAPDADQVGSSAGITALAVSRVDGQLAAAIPQAAGCLVNISPAVRTSSSSSYPLSRTGGTCTSLSWDNGENLWAVNQAGQVWVLQPDTPAVNVSLRAFPRSGHVIALRMAPDGVRAAVLVRSAGQTQLYLSAVIYSAQGISLGTPLPIGGSNLPAPGPTAVSWANAYSLVAIDGVAVYQVPLTGGQSQFLTALPTNEQVTSISAASNQLAIGTSTGRATGRATGRILLSQGSSYFSWAGVPGASATPWTVAFPG